MSKIFKARTEGAICSEQRLFSQSEKEKEREIFDRLFGKVGWMGG